MLSEYRRYLVSIRNNMIRCGVNFGRVEEPRTYEETFNFGERLNDLLWFYSILSISGSEDRLRGFMFPLDAYYMSKMKDKYFEEYLLYRADYMQISASDKIKQNQKDAEPDIDDAFLEDLFSKVLKSSNSGTEVQEDKDEVDEDDDFVEPESEEELDETDDPYANWGNDEDDEDDEDFITPSSEEIEEDDDFIEQNSDEEDDPFANWGNTDDGDDDFVEASSEEVEDGNEDESEGEEEDTYAGWGNSYEEEDEEEDLYAGWGNNDDELEDTAEEEVDEEDSDEEEDLYANWGSSEDEDEDEQEGVDEEDLEDDPYANWGNDEEESEELEEEEDDDPFANWGSGEDEEEYESQDDTLEEDDDPYANWGSSDENAPSSDEPDGNSVSSCDSSHGSVKSAKSKYEYERESNIQTAKNIEKIASSIFSKGGLLKSKVAERLKNSSD